MNSATTKNEQACEEDFCKNGNHTWMGSVCKDCAKPVPTTVQTLYWAAAALASAQAKLVISEAGAAAMRQELIRLHEIVCEEDAQSIETVCAYAGKVLLDELEQAKNERQQF